MISSPYFDLKVAIEKVFGIDFDLQKPRDESHGDWAIAVFEEAKKSKINPIEYAQMLAAKWNESEYLYIADSQAVAPGFVNFNLSNKYILDKTLTCGDLSDFFPKKDLRMIVEYASPNIAKEMHVGHLRGIFVGSALANIYEELGYEVIRASHYGDWGTQFGIIIAEYVRNFGQDLSKAENTTIQQMEKLYVDGRNKEKENSDLETQSREWLVKLQNGDDFANKLWNIFCKASLAEFAKVFERLGAKFDQDAVRGESSYNDMLPNLVEDALQSGKAELGEIKGDGRPVIIPLEKYKIETPVIIRKSDGGYLYHTTDLACIDYRQKKYNQDGKLAGVKYIVGNEQSFHFNQLFYSALELGLLSEEQLPNWQHVKMNFIIGETGKKFSTRDGKAIHVSDVINRAYEYALDILKEKNPDLSEQEYSKRAEAIGIGALRGAVLVQNPNSAITFDWDKMLDFSGDSVAYLQYTYARVNSLLEKNSDNGLEYDEDFINQDKALSDLFKICLDYPYFLERSAIDNNTAIMMQYNFKLSSAITVLYHGKNVMELNGREKDIYIFAFRNAMKFLKKSMEVLILPILNKM